MKALVRWFFINNHMFYAMDFHCRTHSERKAREHLRSLLEIKRLSNGVQVWRA